MLEVRLSREFTVLVTRSTEAAKIAARSRPLLLRRIGAALEAEQKRNCSFMDWLQCCVDTKSPDCYAEDDDLFASYRTYCHAAGIPHFDRASYQQFCSELDRLQLAKCVVRGREARSSCNLKPIPAGMGREPPGDTLREFLDEICIEWGRSVPFRIGAADLGNLYSSWADARGKDCLSRSDLSATMSGLGLTKKHSNGSKWTGIHLHEAFARVIDNPRAPAFLSRKSELDELFYKAERP